MAKDSKAKKDAKRGVSLQFTLSTDLTSIGQITEANMPVSLEEREAIRALAEQLDNHGAFKREQTWVATDEAALRVSPLQGVSLVREPSPLPSSPFC